jgi:hypothetical protein
MPDFWISKRTRFVGGQSDGSSLKNARDEQIAAIRGPLRAMPRYKMHNAALQDDLGSLPAADGLVSQGGFAGP